jgi:hypothetical protein
VRRGLWRVAGAIKRDLQKNPRNLSGEILLNIELAFRLAHNLACFVLLFHRPLYCTQQF